jgi:uncharacterized protein YbbC (DUF1343 family)
LKNIAVIISIAILSTCGLRVKDSKSGNHLLILGAERTSEYLPLLAGKRLGIVANHSTTIKDKHLVDSLKELGVNIAKIYCPEHGFRGDSEAGELIGNSIDERTGIPVVSLYGNKKKPSHSDFSGVDIIIFDMQDVGVRFYTYISTMHYVMETAAELALPVIILDRPNPNGFYVDGPMLETKFKSFVGMHPVPLVHGMTIGEFAQMINGQGWLDKSMKCDLTVIPCLNYSHDSTYILPIKPSPNLPNQRSIYLYPSIGFFEGTNVSLGRGTDFPFQVFGHPSFTSMQFAFTPESRPNASKNPPFMGVTCHGVDLRGYSDKFFLNQKRVNLTWLLFAYQLYSEKDKFFNSYFNLLAGNSLLRQQIEHGLTEETIRKGWEHDLVRFMEIRKKYLLYPDFKEEIDEQ